MIYPLIAWWFSIYTLVGGLEHGWIMTFHILGMSSLSSFQLTNSLTPWFFRGVGQPPTRLSMVNLQQIQGTHDGFLWISWVPHPHCDHCGEAPKSPCALNLVCKVMGVPPKNSIPWIFHGFSMDFPWNKPSSCWGSPMTMETPISNQWSKGHPRASWASSFRRSGS